MTRTELIQNVAEKTSVTKEEAGRVIRVVFEELADCMVRRDSIQIHGFGTFGTTYRKERIGKNPQTKEPMVISSCYTPSFKASTSLKRQMNSK